MGRQVTVFHSFLEETREETRKRPRPRKDEVDIEWARALPPSSLHGPPSFFQKVLCGFCLFSLPLLVAATVQRQQ